MIETNAGILPIGPLGTNFSDFLIKLQKLFILKNASENIVFEMAAILSSRWRWVNVHIYLTHTCSFYAYAMKLIH